MVFCLDSKDYMQIRNSLIILMKILPHFPVLTKLSQIIEKKVEKVKDEEKNQRQDLYILAASYIGQLKAKASQMIRESDFHQVKEAAAEKVVNGDTKAGEFFFIFLFFLLLFSMKLNFSWEFYPQTTWK